MSGSTALPLACTELVRDFGKGDGRRRAVRSVSLSVQPGEVHALVGPNGAGKTTTVRMCSTLLTPTSGSAAVAGHDTVAATRAARRSFGLVLGGDRGFYQRASALENLRFFSALAEAPASKAACMALLETVGLADRAHSKVETFSRGMVQRLHIARALAGSPPLLLLDEPTIGLDPESALGIRQTVKALGRSGAGVLLTSHNMLEVEELASTISVIVGGRLIASGDAASIRRVSHVNSVTTLIIDADSIGFEERLAKTPEVIAVRDSAHDAFRELIVMTSVPWTHIAWDGIEEMSRVRAVATRDATLEDSYLMLTADDRGNP